MAMATTTLPADSLDPSLRTGLLEYFPSYILTPDSAPLLAEVLSILRIYNLTPSDLADKWESFCLNKKHLLAEFEDGDLFQLENVRELKKHIQESLERETRNKRTSMGTPIARGGGKMGMADDIFAAISPQTPSVKRKITTPSTLTPLPKSRLAEISNVTPTASSPLASKSSSETPFAQRRQPGALLQTLNQQIELPDLHSISEVGQIPFTVNLDMKKFGFRTMHQSLMTASEVLDDRIDSFAEVLQEQYSIPAEEITNPARASPVPPASKPRLIKNEIVAVGRICLDPPTTTARPTITSLVLETSRRLGGGSRVPLKLSNIPSVSLFPGQVVGVRGVNASGAYLAVQEILLPQRLPCPDVTTADLLTRGMRMIVASGPWGTETGGWEGFEEVCRVAQTESVDVLILMGPFLDEAHHTIQNGSITIPNGPPTMESLFKHQISSRLRSITDTQIILIPHIRDVVSSHAVWPQEAFSRAALDLPKNVRCLTNPAVFGLGETTIGVSTNDILRGISLEECMKNPVNTGLYDRIPNYILQQRHFYPLFPARVEARVAIQESGLGEFVGGTPDILILPSELQYFAKVVDGVVVINPGSVSKKASAGTFARVYIAPKNQSGDMDVDGMKAEIWERCRVDLHRI